MAKLIITQNTKWLLQSWKQRDLCLNSIELERMQGKEIQTFDIIAGQHTLTVGGSSYFDHSLPFEFKIASDESKSFQLCINQKPIIAYSIMMICNLLFWLVWILGVKEVIGQYYSMILEFILLLGFGLPAWLYMTWFMIARSEQLFFFQENKKA